jgi:uncharacterized membrane protein (UPF0127 family)
VGGQPIRVWLALSEEQRAEGLMFVIAEEIADDQGMLFVFREDQHMAFWMKNTLIPLDIAYLAADGRVLRTWTMPPQTLQTFPSGEPALFALEMKAST